MKRIPTVLGEIEINALGETLCHEHVINYNPAFYLAFGEKWFPREKLGVKKETVKKFTIDNPKRILQGGEK